MPQKTKKKLLIADNVHQRIAEYWPTVGKQLRVDINYLCEVYY